MLATLAGEPTESDLANARLVYEPKYDGMRALVELDPETGVLSAGADPRVEAYAWAR